jgi:hypothetical protein
LLLLVVILIIRQKDRILNLSIAAFMLFFFFSFGINKVQDGSDSAFFPFSRMYLALPYATVICFGYYESLRKEFRPSALWISLLAICVCASLKFNFAFQRNQRLIHDKGNIVKVHKVTVLEDMCDDLKDVLKQENASTLILVSKKDGLNYGCAALNQMSTFHPRYERRQWVQRETELLPAKQLLFLDYLGVWMKRFPSLPWIKVDHPKYPIYRLPMSESMKQLGLSPNIVK